MKPLRGPLLALVLAAALAGAARGHDFWVRPSSFRPGLADRIEVDLRVGQGFRGEPVARNPERIAAFFAVRQTGVEEPIVGIDGKAPAGFLRAKPAQDPGKGGLVWIAYRSRPASLELPAEKFESYLADEGLERIVEMRGSLGERAEPGREAYVRCAKSLVVAGPGAGAGFGATFGLPLEIVLEKDPASLAPDEPLCVRLLFRDQPLEGALVGCASETDPASEVRRRTDAEGRVRFDRGADGVRLLRAVHMVRAAESRDADWESYWASLTFEIAPAPRASTSPAPSASH